MARTKQTARKSIRGKAPRKQLAVKQAAGRGFGASAATEVRDAVKTAAVAPDYQGAFGVLADDALGESSATAQPRAQEGAEGEAAGSPFGGQPAAAGFSSGASIPEDAAPFLTFDFRRGAERWPSCVSMLQDEAAMEALTQTVREELREQMAEPEPQQAAPGAGAGAGAGGAYPAAGGYPRQAGGAAGAGAEGAAGLGVQGYSGLHPMALSESESEEDEFDDEGFLVVKRKSDDEAAAGEEEKLKATAPPEARYEQLADGSTALLIPAGCRLQLHLADLLDDGWRHRAEGKKPPPKKSGLDDYYSVWPAAGPSKKKEKKRLVQAYTITMDIKLTAPPPPQGLSLFQARALFVDATGAEGSERQEMCSSDGECVVNAAGGVGRLGQYGDVATTKLDVDRWRRVVITVNCAPQPAAGGGGGVGASVPAAGGFGAKAGGFGGGFGLPGGPAGGSAGGPAGPAQEMRTYVDAKPCATVSGTGGEFDSEGRYSLDPEHGLLLFSSSDAARPAEHPHLSLQRAFLTR